MKNQKKPVVKTESVSPNERDARKSSELAGLLYIFISVTLLFFFILRPSESFWLGMFYGPLEWLKVRLGVTMYLFSFVLWYFGIQKFVHGSIFAKKIEYFGYFFIFLFSNLFFELINGTGGDYGRFFAARMVSLMGNAGTLLLALFGILVGVSLAFDVLLTPFFSGIAVAAATAAYFIYRGVALAATGFYKAFSAAVSGAAGLVMIPFRRSASADPGAEPLGVPAVPRGVTDGPKQSQASADKTGGVVSETVAAAPGPSSAEEWRPRSSDKPGVAKRSEALAPDDGARVEGGKSVMDILDERASASSTEKKSSDFIRPREFADSEEVRARVVGDSAQAGGVTANSQTVEELRDSISRVMITKTYSSDGSASQTVEPESELIEKVLGEARANSRKDEEASGGEPPAEYEYPDPASILAPRDKVEETGEEELKQTAEKLVTTFKNFNIDVKVVHITQGPTVTRYELQPASGVKVSRIVGLSDDLALALATTSLRMEAPIPGKAAIGVEIPNSKPVPVYFSELITLPEFQNSKSPLLFALGKTITGQPIIADLKNMPHLLVAGTTGSGKSVCINTIIASILFHSRPDEVKLIMIDPKMVELIGYNDVPHLHHPVVIKTKDAPFVLEWGIYEMERRYQLLSAFGVRSIESFNAVVEEHGRGEHKMNSKESQVLAEFAFERLEKMPYLVFFIDELADLMMTDKSNKIEDYICRLAQMARAVGIHLVVATQRPSVDVITGLIKANLPSRIAFAVSSSTDSRTILDSKGAEKLIGKGDMLYLPIGLSKPVRVQGAFVRDGEIRKLTEFLKANYEPGYCEDVQNKIEECQEDSEGEPADCDTGSVDDDLLSDAVRLVVEHKMGSASMLQRTLKVGHNRALKLISKMEKIGVVGPFEDKKPRKVLWTLDDVEKKLRNVA